MAQIDLLGFITNELSRRSRAGQAAAAQRFQEQELASRLQESAAERAAQLAENERRQALERERLASGENLSREEMALRNAQFGQELGLSRDRLGLQSQQFGQEFGQRQSEFDRELQLRATSQAENQRLAQQELLSKLAQQTGSPEVLDLIGGQIGIPNLGARLKAQSSPEYLSRLSTTSQSGSGGVPKYRGPMMWDAISGFIPTPGPQWSQYLTDYPAEQGIIEAPRKRKPQTISLI